MMANSDSLHSIRDMGSRNRESSRANRIGTVKGSLPAAARAGGNFRPGPRPRQAPDTAGDPKNFEEDGNE